MLPIIFNVDNRVEAPETYELLKFVLLFINNIEFVDNELKLLNIVVVLLGFIIIAATVPDCNINFLYFLKQYHL